MLHALAAPPQPPSAARKAAPNGTPQNHIPATNNPAFFCCLLDAQELAASTLVTPAPRRGNPLVGAVRGLVGLPFMVVKGVVMAPVVAVSAVTGIGRKRGEDGKSLPPSVAGESGRGAGCTCASSFGMF